MKIGARGSGARGNNLRKRISSLRRRFRNGKFKIALILIVLLIAVLGIFSLESSGPHASLSSPTSCPSTGCQSEIYVTSSAPNTSQWLILKSTSPVISVLTNSSGSLQRYSSYALLNATQIGYICSAQNSKDACAKFQFISQQGWFWDSGDSLLFVHYLGGPEVKIIVSIY